MKIIHNYHTRWLAQEQKQNIVFFMNGSWGFYGGLAVGLGVALGVQTACNAVHDEQLGEEWPLRVYYIRLPNKLTFITSHNYKITLILNFNMKNILTKLQ